METLDSIFETSARCYPRNIAITFNSGSIKEQATYQELDEKASKVTNLLGTLCKEQEVIAVYCKQSIGFVACILGVLRCKGCFAPVDLSWPANAICAFLSKLNVRHVLVDKELLESFQKCLFHWKHRLPHECKFELVRNEVLDANGFVLVRKLSDVKPDTETDEGLAYVMQTSGTTGVPKAVRVPHRCIVPNVIDLRDIFQLVADDVVFLASPYTFDPFIVQMFIAFAAGARLVIVPDSVKMIPSKLCQIIFDEERVTLLQPTPSLMHYIGQDLIQSKVLHEDSSLRVLAFGGESCPTLSTLRQWRSPGSNTMIYNLYGTTEVSCWASCHRIPNDQLAEEGSGDADYGNLRVEDEENFSVGLVSDVPLGIPLLDTVIEIRDENNEVVTEGVGQIYIGGSDRVCFLGDETSVAAGTMRATGDWAYLKNHCIWFCGRRDRQIKRMGKRINLDWVEHKISEKLLSSTCSLVLDNSFSTNSFHSRIHLFVVDQSLSYDNNKEISLRNDLLNLLPDYAQPDLVHVVSKLPMTAHGKTDRNALLSSLQKSSIPGDIKTMRELLQSAWKESLEVNEAKKTKEKLPSNKLGLLKKEPGNLSRKNAEDVMEEDMFIAGGGTSFDAVRLADTIESWISKRMKTPVKLSELLDVILSKSFGTLCSYVEDKLSQNESGLVNMWTPLGYKNTDSNDDNLDARFVLLEKDEEMWLNLNFDNDSIQQGVNHLLKRKLSSPASGTCPTAERNVKKKRLMKHSSPEGNSNSFESDTFTALELKNCFCSTRRGNQCTVCKFCLFSRSSTTGNVTSQAETFDSDETCAQTSSVTHESFAFKNQSQSLSSKDAKAAETHITITCEWRTCLYKCIDASPLVVYSPERCEGEVFIGSHGHVFMCIRLGDGEVLWEHSVGDRVESSAALSMCGKYVIVGCYDGKVYVFNHSTGETHWTFQTGAAVKSSPCIDSQTGVAWVGSHDHHLYGLDVKHKQCVCTINCGGGSCFSSPCISNEPHLVFIATLTGRILATDATEHVILWSQQCPKPVFASPLLIPNGVVCACVDGLVYCFDFQGIQLWHFETCASVFCSPTYIGMECDSNSSGYILFGSHDRCVYCLSLNGKLQWSFTTDGQVYSSPFVAKLNFKQQTSCHASCHATVPFEFDSRQTQMAVFVMSTVGTLFILELYSGVLLGSYSLPGEVFSSPVVFDKRVLVGCRNDFLYSLEVSNTS